MSASSSVIGLSIMVTRVSAGTEPSGVSMRTWTPSAPVVTSGSVANRARSASSVPGSGRCSLTGSSAQSVQPCGSRMRTTMRVPSSKGSCAVMPMSPKSLVSVCAVATAGCSPSTSSAWECRVVPSGSPTTGTSSSAFGDSARPSGSTSARAMLDTVGVIGSRSLRDRPAVRDEKSTTGRASVAGITRVAVARARMRRCPRDAIVPALAARRRSAGGSSPAEFPDLT